MQYSHWAQISFQRELSTNLRLAHPSLLYLRNSLVGWGNCGPNNGHQHHWKIEDLPSWLIDPGKWMLCFIREVQQPHVIVVGLFIDLFGQGIFLQHGKQHQLVPNKHPSSGQTCRLVYVYPHGLWFPQQYMWWAWHRWYCIQTPTVASWRWGVGRIAFNLLIHPVCWSHKERCYKT